MRGYCAPLFALNPSRCVAESNGTTPATLGPTIVRYLSERQAQRAIMASTAKSQRGILWPFGHFVGLDRPVSRVRRRDVERWLQSQRVSDSTLRARYTVVRTFLRWCVAQDLIRSDPTIGVDPPREPARQPRGLRPHQVCSTMDGALDLRTLLMVSLMVEEGLRRAEVAGLQLGRIDFEQRAMVVLGKGRRERTLPLTDQTFELLTAYRATIPSPHAGPVIRSYADPYRGITPDRVGLLVSRALHSAGVDQSGHALRHTMAQELIRRGVPLPTVQQILGHKSLQSTQIYTGTANLPELRKALKGRRYSPGRKDAGQPGG